MKKFKDLKISRKLTMGFLILSIIATIIGGVGIVGIYQIDKGDTRLYEKQTEPLGDMFTLVKSLYQMRVELRTAVINCDDESKIKTCEDNFDALVQTFNGSVEKYGPSISTAASKALFDEATDLFNNEFLPVAEKTFTIAKTGDLKGADNAGVGSTEAITKMFANYDQCLENRLNNAKKTSEENDRLFIIMTIVLSSVMVVGIIFSILLGRYLSRIISRPITKIVDAANEIALGNVNVNVDVDSDDEIGMLALSFNKMISGIKEQVNIAETISNADFTIDVTPRSNKDTLGFALKRIAEALNQDFYEIKNSSDQIAMGSEQVSSGAQALSQGATEQASSIEELSATITEISVQVSENAEFATSGTKYMEKAIDGVAQCSEQMKSMLTSMEEINNSSNEISKIIKVIDDIAFQTNILALNAAVEAARAGSAGKGFAVVADEVRNLASKSADAAKQTTALIEGSINTVNNGAKIAEETAVSLNDVEEKTRYIAVSIEKLAKAANDQAAAIEQINLGIEQISAVVQTNSATAEESAASSEELSGQAVSLRQMVARMKITQTKADENNELIENINLTDNDIAFNPDQNNDYSAYGSNLGKY